MTPWYISKQVSIFLADPELFSWLQCLQKAQQFISCHSPSGLWIVFTVLPGLSGLLVCTQVSFPADCLCYFFFTFYIWEEAFVL